VLVRAEPRRELLGHGRRRRGRVLSTVPKGPLLNSHTGMPRSAAEMTVRERAGVALPALGVDGAAEDHRGVGGQVVDLARRNALASQPAERIASAMRSSISAVDSCLLA
jgi:hypothetical protein